MAMQAMRMVIDPAFTVGEVDERLFGSFVEHMGRAVYGGIYEPGHATARQDGFRRDVLELVRELGVTVVRYPGGNFVSAYDWEDGVGPREQRPRRLDLAWHSIEPNEVGTDEFMRWVELAGTQPMLAVNLGTRGIDAARNFVEYCNAPAGTKYADWRVANGRADPYGVKLWCLGNEMDGPWQVGQKTAVEYGRLAAETGKAMRWVDPSIELCVAGSSNSSMPTFGGWEDTVLDLAWDVADYISLHTYYDPLKFADVDAYLTCSQDLDRMIDTVVATADAVAGRKRSRKRMRISVDEWNVWHQTANPHHVGHSGPWKRAPALAEDEHTVADALVVGCLLITLLRHADRVKIGCLAQLVNVIPPIRTLDGGPAWRQTSFFPFAHASRFGRGMVLRLELEDDDLEATAILGDGALTIFAVNRSAAAQPLELVVRDLDVSLTEHLVLDGDLAASNTAEDPDRVTPRSVTGSDLPPRSWNVLRLHFRTGLVRRGTKEEQ
ncbi:MAG: alpha-L-arabinofuranosidase [Actinomycetota bacterium]|nr:alpha-L-arabinofuranosidase [Actinomycetota bacterium]